jgi:alanine racemase
MSSIEHQRPTVSTIDLDNLAFNFNSVRRFVGEDVKYLAVVKADAYGHGAVECSRRLAAEGVDWFGVALPEEGVELRDAGIDTPILILGGFWPGQEDLIIDKRLTSVVCTVEQASMLDAAAERAGVVAEYHVKIDTGMGRIGVWFDQAAELAPRLRSFEHIRLDGLMTHFAAADNLAQNDFTNEQISRFDAAAATFMNLDFTPRYLDLANSPGAIAHSDSRRKMVRLGGVLYGLGGDVLPRGIDKPELRPVLSLKSKISYIKDVPAGETVGYGRMFTAERDSVIAAIPIGYADGYPRSLSNISRVIVGDLYAPVVGRVSMDWTTIDVTDVHGATVGSDVTLIGGSGSICVRAEDLAAATGTISYEITCGIQERVSRIFTGQK